MYRFLLLLSVGPLLISGVTASAEIILKNDNWAVSLDPTTLAIRAHPANNTTVGVSKGVEKHDVGELKVDTLSATWSWDKGAYDISVRLQDNDFFLSIGAREPGTLELLNQPQAASGRGLIFPLAEGVYIPVGNSTWKDFQLKELSQFNTTQDISLPLWEMDRESFSLSWILTNPFNNTARFVPDGNGVGLTLQHEFTKLDYNTPMTMLLHLGEPDPLAAAKRYRESLIQQGKFKTLAAKIAEVPDAAKLIGAAHTYLWGNGLISAADVTDWPLFLRILKSETTLPVKLRQRFESEPLSLLSLSDGKPYQYQKELLIRAFNMAMDSLARESWQTNSPDLDLLSTRYGELRQEAFTTFSGALDSNISQWGSGVSVRTMEQLQTAGLKRLWIGLGEGWEGGLWHPEAIKAGVEAGFLVAPYDSYETALEKGENPSWATAHLGKKVYTECAIGQKDGSFKAGFQQSGHYTQPDCVRPFLQERIPSILSAAPFNSWFLDAYATGMVFDSYPPAKPITQKQYAAGNEENMAWVNDNLKLPLGSEDGNAVTSRGVLFTHGMQTPVIGWGDKDLQKDKSSKYFLGRWYPDEKPEIFFKSVPLKEPYRTVYFDPRTRIPLYQSVFHGSVVTTHHWLFDNLKLNNVRRQNELLQLLYNVPPLYHLSFDTLKERLPVIKRQDAFFRPLHERLATQGLVDFEWLTPDRLVQRTTFEDGTRLVANFGSDAIKIEGTIIEGGAIAAFIPDVQSPALYRAQ